MSNVEKIKVRSPVAVSLSKGGGHKHSLLIIEEVHLPPREFARCAGRSQRLRDSFRKWFRRRAGVSR